MGQDKQARLEEGKTHLNNLQVLFANNRPDDEYFFMDNPEVEEQMHAANDLPQDTLEEIEAKVDALYDFLREWEPDGLSKADIDAFWDEMNAAKAWHDAE